MSESKSVSSYVVMALVVLVIGYLEWQLHIERERTAPDPQKPLPTFESRIEPLRSEAPAWSAGYYFHVENPIDRPSAQPAIWQPGANQPPQYELQQYPPQYQNNPRYMPAPQLQRQNNPYEPSPQSSPDPILESLRRQNEEWRKYEESELW